MLVQLLMMGLHMYKMSFVSSSSITTSTWQQEVLFCSFQQFIHYKDANDISMQYLRDSMSTRKHTNPNEIACLYNWLFRYITSPTSSSSSVASLSSSKRPTLQEMQIVAWDILVALIESCGWEWMMMTNNIDKRTMLQKETKHYMGQASNLCLI